MPTQPPRACRGCGQTIHGRAACPTCAARKGAAHDDRRGSAYSRGYTAAWSRVSREWLARFPFCGQRADGAFHAADSRCVQLGRRTLAQCVDHMIPLRDGGDLTDPGNLQSLCLRCNTLKG